MMGGLEAVLSVAAVSWVASWRKPAPREEPATARLPPGPGFRRDDAVLMAMTIEGRAFARKHR
jgi:hypothetical protein